MNLKPLLFRILEDYELPWEGTHGIGHWARVLDNGLRLAKSTGGKVEVVRLFALLHDARRINEDEDDGHGQRGADLADELRGDVFDLPDEDFELLYEACVRHTDGLIEADPTIQTCWDADRLDLGRVGITPVPEKLCTPAAKKPAMLRWADQRATFGIVPDFVGNEWGLDIEN